MKIIVDLDVWNCQIRASKPKNQSDPCPIDQIGKIRWFQNVKSPRLNNRIFGTLKGKALRLAKRVIDREGRINISGCYGSIEIDEKDFVAINDRI